MNLNLKKVAPAFFLCLVAAFTALGQGKIAGKVVDKATGETVIGANITVEGANTGGVTDLDGNYFITAPAGSYKLKIEYMGYNPATLDVVVIDKETTYLNAVISEAAEQLNEVVVQAESTKRETVNALLVQQKNSVAMVTGISAEQFRRLPDKSTSDVLKRISGASIQENKFAIIRGLNDRYNMALLNGVPMPSTESDRKAFSFDLIPANLLDNLMISKTATPDMPGDFAGGIIQINTKDIPEENSFFLNVAGSTHSLTTFEEYAKSPTQNKNILIGEVGKNDQIISAQESQNASKDVLVSQAKLFDNNFEPRKTLSAAPNYSLQGGFSKRINLAGNPLGILFSTTYSKGFKYTPFTNNNPNLGNAKTYDESQADGDFLKINNYKTTVNSGTIFNLSYRIGLNNKISLKNLYTFNADDQTILRDGIKYSDGRQGTVELRDYSYIYQASKMLASQLNGESVFGASKIKLKYNAGYTTIERDVPDYKRLLYSSSKPVGFDEALPFVATVSGIDPYASGRFSSKLNEKVYSGSYTLNVPFVFVFKNEIKVGGFHQSRTRSFSARNYAFDVNQNTFSESELLEAKPDEIFKDENITKNRFFQREITPSENKYDASSTLHAGFVMIDNKFSDKLRLIWGVRLESFNQKVMSAIGDKPLEINKTWNDLLPSANLIYSITEKSNARFSYSKTLSRPEFREFAPMTFLDFNLNAIIKGSPDLTRATIQNLDLKYELFLGEGQVISVTPFYKHFTNPVEANVDALGTFRTFSFVNVKSAKNYGVELEWRTSLKPIDNLIGVKIFQNFTFYTNYAWIRSTVDLTGTNASIIGSRPLQGQSPYVLNGGIQYSNTEKGLDMTLALNRIGRRIAFVANESKFLIYENSRTVLDFSVSKKFFKKLTARVVLGDLLAKSQPLVFYQDVNANGVYDKDNDVESFKYIFGWTSNFSLGYTF